MPVVRDKRDRRRASRQPETPLSLTSLSRIIRGMSLRDIITVTLNAAVDRVVEVENFTVAAHQTGREISRVAGGKGINVSRVLATMNAPSIATGFIGKENRSVFDPIFRDGTIADELVVLDGRTRENVTITDRATGAETHIRDIGLEVSSHDVEKLSRKLSAVTHRDSVVIFSGSLPPGINPDAFAGLIDVCTEIGAKVALDTSGQALRAIAAKKLWLMKPNRTELSELAGKDLVDSNEQLRAARHLTSNVEIVLYTLGAEGAYLLTRDVTLHGCVELEPGEVRNTVGCGDVLLGAFVAGYSGGEEVRECFRKAIATASASATTPRTAELDPELGRELETEVRITEVTATH